MQDTVGIQRALIIDDDRDARVLVEDLLKQIADGIEVTHYDPVEQGRPARDFPWFDYDLLILDYDLGQGENGIDWLTEHKREGQFPAVIMLTGAGSEEIAVAAIKAGVHDYLSKKRLSGESLESAIVEALAAHEKEVAEIHSITQQGSAFNKALFYVRLESAARSGDESEGSALLIIDIDMPETLREALGIIGFDNLMRHVAKLGFSQLRKRLDLPSLTPYGESSVAVLVHNISAKRDVEAIATRICKRLDKAIYRYADAVHPFSVSIGGVMLHQQSANAENMLKAACSEARTAAGKSGNTFHVREAPIETRHASAGVCSDGTDIAAAVSQNRLVCYYHPVTPVTFIERVSGWEFFDVNVSLIGVGGHVVGARELRARGSDPNHLRMLDRWAVRECMGVLLEQRRASSEERAIQLFLSLSATTLADETFEPWLLDLVRHIGDSNLARSLVFDISPEALALTREHSVPLMARLRDTQGFRFALTDVLTRTVLDHCTEAVDFDYVKLSPTLTAIDRDAEIGIAVAKVIVEQAQTRAALTVAQDIDDAANLSGVINTGVDLVAGHFVGAPQNDIGSAPLIESLELTDV